MLNEKDWREAYEERAAIMEYDGNMSREEAQKAAWDLIHDRMKEAGDER